MTSDDLEIGGQYLLTVPERGLHGVPCTVLVTCRDADYGLFPNGAVQVQFNPDLLPPEDTARHGRTNVDASCLS